MHPQKPANDTVHCGLTIHAIGLTKKVTPGGPRNIGRLCGASLGRTVIHNANRFPLLQNDLRPLETKGAANRFLVVSSRQKP